MRSLDKRKMLPKQINPYHIMVKPTGPLCNLDCRYCFYLEKTGLYPNAKSWRMSDKVLENYIKNYIQSQRSDTITFAWQGGEPTLCGVEYFEKIVALEKKYGEGKQIQNAFQTNGTLLNDHWGEFLKKENFLVGISIDGPKKIHDSYRCDRKSGGTHDRVVEGLKVLQRHGVEYNSLTCVHRNNQNYGEETYRYLKGLGIQYMQFIPIVERIEPQINRQQPHQLVSPVNTTGENDLKLAPWSVTSAGYGKFLCSIYDRWIRKDIGKIYVQIFDVMLGQWARVGGGLCIFGKTCGTALAMEHNGDVYSCDHYVYPEFKLGNVMDNSLAEMVMSPAQEKFGKDKADLLPKYCRQCSYLDTCNGGCPKHRILKTKDGEAGLNYLCEGFLKFYRHIDPSMVIMAEFYHERRPASEIMSSLKDKSYAKKLGLN